MYAFRIWRQTRFSMENSEWISQWKVYSLTKAINSITFLGLYIIYFHTLTAAKQPCFLGQSHIKKTQSTHKIYNITLELLQNITSLEIFTLNNNTCIDIFLSLIDGICDVCLYCRDPETYLPSADSLLSEESVRKERNWRQTLVYCERTIRFWEIFAVVTALGDTHRNTGTVQQEHPVPDTAKRPSSFCTSAERKER